MEYENPVGHKWGEVEGRLTGKWRTDSSALREDVYNEGVVLPGRGL